MLVRLVYRHFFVYTLLLKDDYNRIINKIITNNNTPTDK